MRRRDFVTLLAGALPWVAAARARGSALIGFLSSNSANDEIFGPFLQGLKDSGFVDGQNVEIEYRWADGRYERLPSLAAELVSRNVAVIHTTDVPATIAAKAATRTIPIVFIVGADPVKLGLIDSFNRPGGNLTGVSAIFSALAPKHIEFLRELAPNARTIAFLVNPNNPNLKIDLPEIQAASDALGQHLETVNASDERELEAAFATMVRHQVDALVVKPDPLFITRREQLVALALRHGIPTIYPLREFVDAGGLMSYGSPPGERFREAGTLIAKVLRGADPATLPVQQTMKFEFIINLKAAKVLGLTVPTKLLIAADEVIE